MFFSIEEIDEKKFFNELFFFLGFDFLPLLDLNMFLFIAINHNKNNFCILKKSNMDLVLLTKVC